MNLNNISLTPQQIADLYTNVLIEGETIAVPEKENIAFLGNNKKNIVVLVHYTDVPFLPDEQLNFLMNILGACHLTLADVAIVNKATSHYSYQKLQQYFATKTIIMFDVDPLTIDLPLSFPHFQIQQFDGLTFLYAPPLQQVENDKELKKQLWTGLKKIFSI